MRVALAADAVEHILLVCLDNLGDLVFTASLAPPLKAHFKAARITLWCKEYAADVAALVPAVDEIVACDPFWDRAPGRAKGSFVRFARTVRSLRAQRHDLAVITSPQWRAAAAVRFTGATVRIAQERRKNRRFLTHMLPPADSLLPVLRDHAHLLDALGVPHPTLRYELDAQRLAAERARITRAVGEPFTALHAFASDRRRCVRLSEWITLARELEQRQERVVWVGSSTELAEVRSQSTAPASWRYADEFTNGTLRETAALLACARLFVGHDSGPLHVANALGAPVVGIFAPGQPARTFPQGVAPSRVLHSPTPQGIDVRAMLAEIDALCARAGAES
ncbi:MAG: glycosyltransferase family 9 protein [Planctomycetes bacterium]|nr:glycosyltransferase family 9 protein [Planctomycetota bacterium]